MDDARGHITEPQEWIDALLREYSAVEDVDEALQNMGLRIRALTRQVEAEQDHGNASMARALRAEGDLQSARNLINGLHCENNSQGARLHRAAHEISKIRRERDALLALVREITGSGLEHDDPRVPYVTDQIGRETWEELRATATPDE